MLKLNGMPILPRGIWIITRKAILTFGKEELACIYQNGIFTIIAEQMQSLLLKAKIGLFNSINTMFPKIIGNLKLLLFIIALL